MGIFSLVIMSTSKNDVFNFKEFPDFQSERLRLSSISEKDATDILSLRTNPKVAKYIDRKQTKDVDAAKEFINYVNNGFTEKKFIFWGIRLMSESPLIGTMSLWHFTDDRKEAEVGYELHPAYWGKGYANEALLKVIEFSFHILKLRKIEAFTHHEIQLLGIYWKKIILS